MREMIFSPFLLLFTVLIVLPSIAGPELFARYRDRAILGQIYARVIESDGEGYRYALSPGEEFYTLPEDLGRQILPENEQYTLTRDSGYGDLDGTYAFALDHKGPSGKEITDYQIYEICNQGLAALEELGILPDTMGNVDSGAYDATLYSAVNVLGPRNNVVIWKLELASIQKNTGRENRLMEAYIDADNGKIYEFYVRTFLTWENVDPGQIARNWAEYMRLEAPTPYETNNSLMEATPYFSKYVYSGARGQETIVTIGSYEGINGLFLKIPG